jgi:O-antigen biosynthesis protein
MSEVLHLRPKTASDENFVVKSLPTFAQNNFRPVASLSICIATPDILGPIRNGGIGTAYAELARALASAGHEVTVLYLLGSYCEQGDISKWVKEYHTQGIILEPLDRRFAPVSGGGVPVECSLSTYFWLRGNHFDIVHFPEWMGLGYFSLQAKRTGLAFSNTTFVVGTHSPSLWHALYNQDNAVDVTLLERDFMERRCVELADIVISPSKYLLDWMRAQGWQLPKNSYVEPNLLGESLDVTHARPSISVNELVFFGRLEKRKGLDLFCNALLLLQARVHKPFQVTFLGKQTRIEGQDSLTYIKALSLPWTFSWQVIDDKERDAAIAYLAQPGRLAVMPSLMENSPYTVLECLMAGMPFLASRVGGIPELIAQDDIEEACFPLRASALADRLARALTVGQKAARASFSPAACRARWVSWHEHAALREKPEDEPLSKIPKVTVCLVHHERPLLLRQAIASLRSQNYSNFEVVLVDDGSQSAAATETLTRLEPEFRELGWKIIRQDNLYLGAARNTAARAAQGDYILFMDDDNVAMPHEIATFIRAAERTNADILTCFLTTFHGLKAPKRDGSLDQIWAPIGDAPVVGVFRNCFGDANALIKRSAFEALGGFTEDYGVGHEDWEFFARASLAGFRLEVVPESLFWYRVQEEGMLRGRTFLPANKLRSLRPYFEALGPQLQNLALFASMAANDERSTGALADEQARLTLEAHWNSRSWRWTRPLRNLVHRMRGLPKEGMPEARTSSEAKQHLANLQGSFWWEITGPLRALRRLL